MNIQFTNLDGVPCGSIDLVKRTESQLVAGGQPVLAVRALGSRVALIIPGRQVCVSADAYCQVLRARPQLLSSPDQRGEGRSVCAD